MTAPVGDDLTWLDDLERAHAEFMPDWWGRMPTATVTDLLDAVPTLVAELRKRDAAPSPAAEPLYDLTAALSPESVQS